MDAEKLEKFFKMYVLIWLVSAVAYLLGGLIYGGLGSAIGSVLVNGIIMFIFLYLLKKFITLLKEG